jgi:hypothetical protein
MDTCQDAEQLASLRNLALGAEALNPATLAQAQRMIPHAVVHNCYGEFCLTAVVNGRIRNQSAGGLI